MTSWLHHILVQELAYLGEETKCRDRGHYLFPKGRNATKESKETAFEENRLFAVAFSL